MARQNINSGSAPIVWSTVKEAFDKINLNFTELYASIGGGDPVDFSNLSTNVSPSDNEVYDLGSDTKRWRDLYLSGSSLYLGDAVITSTGSIIELPEGSTIGGALLDNTYFKSIAVSGQSPIEAESGGEDVLTFANGSGISITTNPSTDTLTITNSGVTSASAGTGISVSGTNPLNITNTGIISASAGTGISVSGTNPLLIANTGIISVVTDPGSGISLDTSTPGVVRITNSAPNVIQDTFRNIRMPNLDLIQADGAQDTLQLLDGSGISITGTDLGGSDVITITNTGVTSLGGGTGISVSSATGSVNITNLGVISLSAGDGISLSAGAGDIVVSNSRFGFTSIAAQGQSPILADNTTDTLVLIAGSGIELVSDPSTDSLTISANANIQTNIYGSDSTLIVNGDDNSITASSYNFINGAQITNDAGDFVLDSGSATATAIRVNGSDYILENNKFIFPNDFYIQADSDDFILNTVSSATGVIAFELDGGTYVFSTASITTPDDIVLYSDSGTGSVVLNAAGSSITPAVGFYVDPIREYEGPQVLYYDPTGTKEITWGPVPAGTGGGGGGGGDFLLYVAGDDSTEYRMNSGEILQFTGSNGITVSTDAEGKFTIDSGLYDGSSGFSFDSGTSQSTIGGFGNVSIGTTGTIEIFGAAGSQVYIGGGTGGGASGNVNLGNGTNSIVFLSGTSGISYNDLDDIPSGLGNITFTGSTIDTSDSGSITFTPLVTFSSDVVVENDLRVNNIEISGDIITTGSGTPELISDNDILLTAGSRVKVTQSPFKLASFTDTERDALIAENGDMIYNTTNNRLEAYVNNAWVVVDTTPIV
jgi:hypothetical protein